MDETLPKVSICIPVYNGEQTILRAVHSATHQTYPNLEIVVSDNGSTDNTVKLITENYSRQSNLNLIVRDQNYGIVDNFVYVVEKANGEYVMTMGADDELPGDSIAELVKEISKNHAIAAFGRTLRISSDGSVSVVLFGQYSKEQEIIRAICSKEKINYLICGLWRRDVYLNTLNRQVKRYALIGTAPDRLFVFFALFNYGVNYQLSDKIVYKKYYENRSNRSEPPLIKSKVFSVINTILFIRKNQRRTFLYLVFLPQWIVFETVQMLSSSIQMLNSSVRLNVVPGLFISWVKNNIKPETRQKLKAVFRRRKSPS